MRVKELSVVVDFPRQIRVIFLRRLEDDLEQSVGTTCRTHQPWGILGVYLGSIGEFVCSQIHFSERTLADQPPQCVISHRAQLIGGEFSSNSASA